MLRSLGAISTQPARTENPPRWTLAGRCTPAAWSPQTPSASRARKSSTCRSVTMNGGSRPDHVIVRAIDDQAVAQRRSHIGRPSTARSMPIIKPSPRTSRMKSNSAPSRESPARSCAPRCAHVFEQIFVLRSIARNSSATAQASGPPPKVEPCKPGENASAKLSCARIAPSGSPPASGLATTTMSGKPDVPLVGKRRGRCGPGRTEFRRRSARRRSAKPAPARASRTRRSSGRCRLRPELPPPQSRRPNRRISLPGRRRRSCAQTPRREPAARTARDISPDA